MRTAGVVLKEAREAQKRTLAQVSRRTRIKQKFLTALEDSDWENLPNFSVAQGFARAYALNVGAEPSLVAALIRRDFPEPRITRMGNEISLRPQSIWTPKATIIASIALCLALLGIYLGRQYLQFAAPPPVSISKMTIRDGVVGVAGKTSPSATLEINGRPVLVESDGTFRVEVERQDLINSQIIIEATSRTGKKSTVSKSVD